MFGVTAPVLQGNTFLGVVTLVPFLADRIVRPVTGIKRAAERLAIGDMAVADTARRSGGASLRTSRPEFASEIGGACQLMRRSSPP